MTAWLLAALLPTAVGDDQWLAWDGIARAPQTQQILYAEQHWLRVSGGQPIERVVLYRCPSGGAFARKHVDYRLSRVAPAFALDDVRSGYREGLAYDNDGSARVFFRESANDGIVSATLNASTLVADAGFDEFIRLHWEQLLAGEPQVFSFAVPARGSSYRFSLRRLDPVEGDTEMVRFRLHLSGMLKWFAPAIEVSYAAQTRQLAHFRGLANLRDERGKQMQAWIDFPEPARSSTRGAAETARTTSLRACDQPIELSNSGQRPSADTGNVAVLQ